MAPKVRVGDPGTGNVVLITGPAGSGKSTLAQHVAQQLGWESVSEDDYWVENGWGSGLRTPEQEKVVQHQVLEHVRAACQLGRSVVLEFILYAMPPNPLTAYQLALAAQGIACQVIVLKPTVTEIVRRLEARGRPEDVQQLPQRRDDARRQVLVLETATMPSDQVIDNTDLSVEEVYRTCLPSLLRPPA